MKTCLILLVSFTMCQATFAQTRKAASPQDNKNTLPDIHNVIQAAAEHRDLFSKNLANKDKEHDVNSIILDIEKYIDSLPKTRTYADVLLNKYFAPLRLFYLTTTNKTTVATSFLYVDVPYNFALYNDTALCLHLGAIKDGDTYDLSKTTENRIAKNVLESCLLPSLKALDEFKEADLKYIALSSYYGCKDSREGATATQITPYCMTLLARLTDIQQYNTGLLTAKGLLAVADIYLSDSDDTRLYRKVHINMP